MPTRQELSVGAILALGILALVLASSVTPAPWQW
jgi:hypothetical protein